MLKLTLKQQRIYDFIQEYIEANQASPSLREIGRALDISVGTAQDQVEAIRRKGLLERHESKARGIRLPIKPLQVPILGRVHAGPLHPALEDIDGYLPVESGMSTAQYFALRIRGDSMMDAGILEGDVVLVRSQAVANDGDIVVARIEDETTVKRLRRKDNKTILEPENRNYSIIESPFDILGVVVEVRRLYKK